MSFKFKVPTREVEDADVLLPIMSLMLILIPVLVGNMAFYHFHAVRVNSPAVSEDAAAAALEKKKSTMKVMARLKILPEIFNLELLDEDSGNIIVRKEIRRDTTGVVHLRKELNKMVEEYKKLDVLLLSSYRKLRYEQLITILDEGVKSITDVKTKKSALKVVMVPEEV